MTEANAHLKQGRSQLRIYRFLAAQERDQAPEAHILHFLQMATENIAKAVHLRMVPDWDKFRHTAFARIPQLLRRRDVSKTLGWSDFQAYKRFMSDVFPLCQEIERLHPQVGVAIDRPNVEYPWRGRSPQGVETWFVPALHEFGLLGRMRRSLGTRLVGFLEVLIERFEHVPWMHPGH